MAVLLKCLVDKCKRETYKNGECIIHSKIETKPDKLLRNTVREECHLGEYNFFGIISYEDFSLNNLKILKNSNVDFKSASFNGTFRAKEIDLFTSKIDFTESVFNSEINIELCNIFGIIILKKINVLRRANFSLNDFQTFEVEDSKFSDKVKIVNSVFKNSFLCRNTVFEKDVNFSNTSFLKDAIFENVIFEENADFNLCEFHSNTVFKSVLFKKSVNIETAKSSSNFVTENTNIFK